MAGIEAWLPQLALLGLASNFLVYYVFVRKLPSTLTTNALRLLMFVGIYTNAGDVFVRTLAVQDIHSGPVWWASYAFLWSGIMAIGYASPNFVLAAGRQHRLLLHPATRPVFAAFAVFFLVIALLTPTPYEFMPPPYYDLWLWAWFSPVLLIGPVLFSWLSVRGATTVLRRQARLLLVGVSVPVLGGLLEAGSNVIGMPIRGPGTLLTPVLALVLAYGISREKLFLVSVGTEKIRKQAESTGMPRLAPGQTRVFLGDGVAPLKQFGVLVGSGRRGIVFTSGKAGSVRKIAGLTETPVLEFRAKPEKGQLDPRFAEHREMVPVIVEDYATEAGDCVVLLHAYHLLAAVVPQKDRREMVMAIRRIIGASGGNLLIHGRLEDMPEDEIEWFKSLARSPATTPAGPDHDGDDDAEE